MRIKFDPKAMQALIEQDGFLAAQKADGKFSDEVLFNTYVLEDSVMEGLYCAAADRVGVTVIDLIVVRDFGDEEEPGYRPGVHQCQVCHGMGRPGGLKCLECNGTGAVEE